MKNRASGFYLTLVAAILALVDVILYGKVMYTMPVVYGVLIAAVVVELLAIVINKRVFNNFLPIIEGVLLGYGLAMSFFVMVNQIGYVIAGLDKIDTLYSFIAFAVIAGIAMLLSIVAGFLKQQKDE